MLLATAAWVGIYLFLGYRLWQSGVNLGDRLSLGLAGLSIVLGVGLVFGWRGRWRLWMQQRRRSQWPPLNLEELQQISPSDFEAYVAHRLFRRKGYAVVNTQDVKDGGVDVLVTDRLGQTAVVQCKRYRGTVGEAVVRDLLGTMVHNRAAYGYLVTTGNISAAAEAFAAGKPISLIDGPLLVELSRAD